MTNLPTRGSYDRSNVVKYSDKRRPIKVQFLDWTTKLYCSFSKIDIYLYNKKDKIAKQQTVLSMILRQHHKVQKQE